MCIYIYIYISLHGVTHHTDIIPILFCSPYDSYFHFLWRQSRMYWGILFKRIPFVGCSEFLLGPRIIKEIALRDYQQVSIRVTQATEGAQPSARRGSTKVRYRPVQCHWTYSSWVIWRMDEVLKATGSNGLRWWPCTIKALHEVLPW
jgi:hypothetical protein